ncbi:protein kinase [Patulibacter brassicae]|uniref:non-specific serine/threonine protein kinase n=1 Tax=Patulibacter brassicae TaxID=1705717 RepID=A0ABU4VNP3_9ACTN|nr:protein kinase [Patulibacter brassicae]MDX8153472.1 protein kinase [Patulibacter brassicae]
MSGDLLVGRYELGDRLGSGGMSTVRLAFDRRLERHVAVKLLAEHLADDRQFVSRFRREALSAARLVHNNIVQVFDFGFDDDSHRYFIVMEAVRGQSGAELLRDRGYLSVPETVSIVGQAARGLDYAHRNGVIHRDVKPGNILLSDDGTVKIADFGIAKAMAEESSITQIGSVVGTASYLAPEQATGGELGPASDIYALGVVTYQMLAARLPYEADSLAELALKQQREAPPLLDQLNAEVPPELGLVVDRALSLDPGMRYASADAYAQALDDGAAGNGADLEDRTRVVDPGTGATAIVGRDQIASIARDFDPPFDGEDEDAGDRTLLQPGPGGRRSSGTDEQPAAPRRTAREPRRAPVREEPRREPAGGWIDPRAQQQPARAPRQRGCLGRLVRALLIVVLLAAIVGGAIYYVVGQEIAPRLDRVVGDNVQQVVDEFNKLIDDNTK